MRKEPDRNMEKSYASRTIKRFKEVEATAFWDMTPCSTIETVRISGDMSVPIKRRVEEAA
jgi:hypothetical protein